MDELTKAMIIDEGIISQELLEEFLDLTGDAPVRIHDYYLYGGPMLSAFVEIDKKPDLPVPTVGELVQEETHEKSYADHLRENKQFERRFRQKGKQK